MCPDAQPELISETCVDLPVPANIFSASIPSGQNIKESDLESRSQEKGLQAPMLTIRQPQAPEVLLRYWYREEVGL